MNTRRGRVWKEGVLVGYVAGLISAGVAALLIWLISGALSIESRMDGYKLSLTGKTEVVEVETAYSIPERYSLINDEGDTVYVPVYKDVEKNPYDWSCLRKIEGYKYYAPDGIKACKIGIDVSKYQSEIDWEQVKTSGVAGFL